MSLAQPRDDYGQLWARPSRRRLALFLVLAAWIHLLAFLGWERLGFEYLGGMADLAAVPQTLELTLELNPAAAPTESLTPAAPPAAASAAEFGQEPPPTAAPPAEFDPESPPAAAPPAKLDPESPPAASEPTLDTAAPAGPLLESGASLWPEGAEAAPAAPPVGQDNTVSVEETAPRLKSYNSTVRGAVARHWLLPPEARNNFQPGRFTAVMTLDRHGQIALIAVEESSGSPSLDYAAMEAIRGAAPFEPFPPELADHDQLSFRLHFDYRAVYRQAGPLR